MPLCEVLQGSKSTLVETKLLLSLEYVIVPGDIMKLFIGLLCSLFTLGLAQGGISGTLYANDVKGFVIIGCLLNLSTQDCDYDKSPYIAIDQSGTSAPFALEQAPAGQYLIIAWKDTNNNGNLDEATDEVGYYISSDGQPGLITPPMQQVDIRVGAITQQSTNQTLVGSWSDYGYLGDFLDGNTTSKLDFLDTSNAYSLILNADGSYSSLEYNLIYDSTLDRYVACFWTKLTGTYTLQADELITTIQTEETATCGLTFALISPLTRSTETFLLRFEGDKLDILETAELTSVDESYWQSGYAHKLTRDAVSSKANPLTTSNPLTQTTSQNPLTTNTSTVTNPLTTNQSETQGILGSWSTSSYFGDYVDANTGAYAGDAQSAHGVTFNADGTYNMVDYYDLDSSCKWFKSKGTYTLQADRLMIQTLEYEISECGGAFIKQPNETRDYLWRFAQYEDGIKLELLGTASYRDEKDWFYANRYSRVKGEE
jgi:hypothetical protein